MPTSGPEKCTATETSGLAQSRISFPTDNEPIFRYRRQDLNPARGAHFAGIPFVRSPDPLQKIRERSHFSPRDCDARVRGAARQNSAKSQFAMLSPGRIPIVSAYGQNKWLCPGQPAYERSPRRPGAPAIQSNPAKVSYCNACRQGMDLATPWFEAPAWAISPRLNLPGG